MTPLEIISRLCEITEELSGIVKKQQEMIERSKVEEGVKEELRNMVNEADGNGSRSVESTVGSRNRKRQESLDDNAERRDVSVLWILHGCVRSEVVVCSI